MEEGVTLKAGTSPPCHWLREEGSGLAGTRWAGRAQQGGGGAAAAAARVGVNTAGGGAGRIARWTEDMGSSRSSSSGLVPTPRGRSVAGVWTAVLCWEVEMLLLKQGGVIRGGAS